MIRDLLDFKWPESIKIDPARWERNKRCSYHKDHNHTTEQCKSPHYLVEKLIKAGHLKHYVHITSRQKETSQELAVQAPTSLVVPRVVINYIHGDPVNDKHNSKRQRWRLLHATSVKEWVNSIQHNFSEESVRPIDGTITFPSVGANRVLQLHEDALVPTLRVGGFNVRRVLVDPGSSANLLQMSAYR